MADDDACVSCGQVVSICDHAMARLTDPMLAFQGKVISELTADLAAERRISERMRESRDRVIGQRDMLLAEITDGGFCKLCDGFGPDGYPIVHRESCPTRFEYRALAADARRDGPEG